MVTQSGPTVKEAVTHAGTILNQWLPKSWPDMGIDRERERKRRGQVFWVKSVVICWLLKQNGKRNQVDTVICTMAFCLSIDTKAGRVGEFGVRQHACRGFGLNACRDGGICFTNEWSVAPYLVRKWGRESFLEDDHVQKSGLLMQHLTERTRAAKTKPS